MGSEMRRWLADHLPAALSTGERLVALEAADCAWEETRIACQSDLLEIMIRRTGYSDAKQIGKVLGKLAARGIELRAPVRTKDGQIVRDKIGRVVYACKGHELEFYIPLPEECPALMVPPAGDLQSSPQRGTKAVNGPPPGPNGPPPGPQSSPQRGTPTSNTSDTSIDLSASESASTTRNSSGTDDPAFVAFWEHYPKKTDKAGARRQWQRLIKDGVDPQEVITGAKTYASEWHGATSGELHWAVKSSKWLADEMWSGAWPLRRPDRNAQQQRGGARSETPAHGQPKKGITL